MNKEIAEKTAIEVQKMYYDDILAAHRTIIPVTEGEPSLSSLPSNSHQSQETT